MFIEYYVHCFRLSGNVGEQNKDLAFQQRRQTVNKKHNKLKCDKYYGKNNNQTKTKEISSSAGGKQEAGCETKQGVKVYLTEQLRVRQSYKRLAVQIFGVRVVQAEGKLE